MITSSSRPKITSLIPTVPISPGAAQCQHSVHPPASYSTRPRDSDSSRIMGHRSRPRLRPSSVTDPRSWWLQPRPRARRDTLLRNRGEGRDRLDYGRSEDAERRLPTRALSCSDEKCTDRVRGANRTWSDLLSECWLSGAPGYRGRVECAPHRSPHPRACLCPDRRPVWEL